MSQEIFISYRRKDTGGYAGRLYDYLVAEYGAKNILFDIKVDATVEELRAWVKRVVPAASVVLVLIGEQWIEDRNHRRRLEEPDDIVRLEIELACRNKVPLIPIMVDGATFPNSSSVPPKMRKVTEQKGYELSNSSWEQQLQVLLHAIGSVVNIHTPILRRGLNAWAEWRKQHPDIIPNLTGADLAGEELEGVDLSRAILRGANLQGAMLRRASLHSADLTGAILRGANLEAVEVCNAKLVDADLSNALFVRANLDGVDFSNANLNGADFSSTSLKHCQVYGVSVWDTKLGDALQSDLYLGNLSTGNNITVDNIQMAVVIHLLLTSGGIRNFIDTMTTKVVLVLGRFTKERKAILDAIFNELRFRNYTPLLFDFDKPQNRNLTETLSTMAHMAKFIIADITDAISIPHELQAIVPNLPSIPVKPILLASQIEYGMFEHFKRYPWVLETFSYRSVEEVVSSISEKIIEPLEAKAVELRRY